MQNPYDSKRNQGVHYADDIVFDKVLVFENALFHER